MKVKHEAAVAAAEWWAKKIDGTCKHDNGDTGLTSLLAMCMADSLNKPVTEEQLEMFKAELIQQIETTAESYKYKTDLDLYCDYGPGFLLADAARCAGISKNNFPYKTGMTITEEAVTVRDGYRAQRVTIWPTT